jgi:cystathionine beta-lyase
MVEGMRLFRIGASFGGFESLITPARPAAQRTARPWREPGFLLRLHVGLEAVSDLIADLDEGFARLHAALRAAPSSVSGETPGEGARGRSA